MIRKQSWLKRWLEVEEYKKWKEIRSVLVWIVGQPHYRALLEVFVMHDCVFDSAIGIKECLRDCIARVDAGESINAGAFLEIDGSSAPGVTMSTWLRNACRQDLGGMPETAAQVVPITCNCDSASAEAVAATGLLQVRARKRESKA